MMAVILAGGKGTRLAPYTATFPKPLVPLGDMPVLEILLRQLKAAGVTEVILAVNHLHHLIRAFCGDGRSFGLDITYCLEEHPLGTAGALALMLDDLPECFVVVNGDLLTSFDIGAMIDSHVSLNRAVSIAVHERRINVDFGLVETDGHMRLTEYREKPSWSHLVSMGLYMFSRAHVSPLLRAGEPLDMPDLLKRLMASGVQVDCVRQDCIWMDIGRPDDYAHAQELFERERALFIGSAA